MRRHEMAIQTSGSTNHLAILWFSKKITGKHHCYLKRMKNLLQSAEIAIHVQTKLYLARRLYLDPSHALAKTRMVDEVADLPRSLEFDESCLLGSRETKQRTIIRCDQKGS